LAYVTQTTLSVDDTIDIIAALQARFPAVAAPHKEDICYATTNRQDAVKAIADRADVVLVQEVIAAIRQHYLTTIDEISVTEETTHFKLPRALTA
ncbi:MAG TPA: hypothetical protein VJ790_03175, partial [Dongiaceae bacterium]|nr:hypothetical protein [Dongiaceae bacterium]